MSKRIKKQLTPIEQNFLVAIVGFNLAIQHLVQATNGNKQILQVIINREALRLVKNMPEDLIDELLKDLKTYE